MQSTNGQQEPPVPTSTTSTPTSTSTPTPTPTPTPIHPPSSADFLDQNDQHPSTILITHNDHDQLDFLSSNVKQLALIFPQIQPSILQDVLAAHHNDTAQSIPDLLAMSDPSWKPSFHDIVKSDEALARQLAQQEALHHQTTPPHQLPYQPRIKKNPPSRIYPSPSSPINASLPESSSSALSPAAKDEIQKMADEFSKMAESGKKTVSTWLSKAKAKLQEMQQPQPNPDPLTHPAPSYQPKHTEGELVATGSEYGSSSITPRPSRVSPALPYASRYESLACTNKPQSITPTTLTNTSIGSKPSVAPSVQGYHLDENPNPVTGPGIKTVTADATSTPQSGKPLPGTPTGAPMSSTRHQTRDDDEESLEYTRNPFEDDD